MFLKSSGQSLKKGKEYIHIYMKMYIWIHLVCICTLKQKSAYSCNIWGKRPLWHYTWMLQGMLFQKYPARPKECCIIHFHFLEVVRVYLPSLCVKWWPMITFWLMQFLRKLSQYTKLRNLKVETGYSWALIQSVLLSFNKENISNYLDRAFGPRYVLFFIRFFARYASK